MERLLEVLKKSLNFTHTCLYEPCNALECYVTAYHRNNKIIYGHWRVKPVQGFNKVRLKTACSATESSYSKTCLSGHSKRRPKLVFKTNYRLMQVKSIAECSKGSIYSKGSILQYFGPSLSYHLSLKVLFCVFLSGRLRQVLLYIIILYEGSIAKILSGEWMIKMLIWLCGRAVWSASLLFTYEPRHEISNNVVCATSKASDQPAH